MYLNTFQVVFHHDIIGRTMLELLNRCFQIEKLVASWKDADIAPIPKTATEYRPI